MTPRFEALPGLLAHGPTPLAFGVAGSTGAWSGRSEGFIVRFHPNAGESWIGNFQPGSGTGSGGWEGVLEHPNGDHLIVVARGQGYIVDPEERQLVSRLEGYIQHALPLPELDAIVFSDGIGFEAIKSSGVWWRSPRISWDEIRNIRVEGTILHGEALSIPTHAGDRWIPFTLDLMTGHCEDGVYEDDMRGVFPVTRPSQQ